MSGTDNDTPVVFHCFGGTHTSVLAAAIRCRLAGPPDPATLARLPWFDKIPYYVAGVPIPIGRDPDGREVFTLGRCGLAQLVNGFAPRFLARLGLRPPILIDAGQASNLRLKAGGFVTRRLGLHSWGRSLLTEGTLRAWSRLAQLAAAERKTPAAVQPCRQTIALIFRGQPTAVERTAAHLAGESSSGSCMIALDSLTARRVVLVRTGVRTRLATTVLTSLIALSDPMGSVTAVDGDAAAQTARRGGQTLWEWVAANVDGSPPVGDNWT